MAQPERNSPHSLDEALARLRQDPTRPVRAHVDDIEVELRAVGPVGAPMKLGDWMAAAGPWEGESADEILAILREGRESGGSADAPDL